MMGSNGRKEGRKNGKGRKKGKGWKVKDGRLRTGGKGRIMKERR